MDISVIGSGYVGTTLAACLAELGHDVVNVDIDEEVVATLTRGEPPIHEEHLPELVSRHVLETERLSATTDYTAVLDTEATFVALPTPSREDGSIDLSIMEAGAEQLGETLTEKDAWHTVIVKSTVVPGSTQDLIAPLVAEASGNELGEEVGVGMNPEFLREGTAVMDFMEPDKVVLGADDDRTLAVQRRVYEPLTDRYDTSVVETGTREAEMMKYANNAFLAAKVSLINDLGNICKELGVDTYEIADAMGLDDRITRSFLDSGLGWGGSCFPKDVAAIIAAARAEGYEPPMLTAAVEVNEMMPERLLGLLDDHLDVTGKRVALLGLSFKPGTDDVRETRSAPLLRGLAERGADVVAHDPAAVETMRKAYPDLEFAVADSPEEALDGAYACLVATDWPEYADLDAAFDAMAHPLVLDGRHCIEPREGLVYEGLTW
ncbi:UDP-glucose 6-dehydrogenase AglM [Salinigranum halophilum]|jgi:UDPglucose 6-dehydrogenase|uniref:UDP-glucose 6-dehydrogenase AglM n=1 Tax=Salinigranum halophilum TaxID=2565931 RepID=UPI00115D9FEE|nr:UDP-glucose 6-dehydrogenase AglM [Salinigranum halophilum]